MSPQNHVTVADTRWFSVDDATQIGEIATGSDVSSVVRMKLAGEHRGEPNRRSEFVYVVTSGKVTFTMDDGTTFNTRTGDVVRVDKNEGRTLKGHAELLLINTPPWRAEDEAPKPDPDIHVKLS